MPRRSKVVNRHWIGFTSGANFTGLGAGSAAATLLPAQHDRETLMRTRGNLLAYLDGIVAPGGAVSVSVGMILVPEGTGTTVLWDPFSDDDAPWFYYSEFVLGYEEMVTDVIDVPGATAFREVIDSKAMRRVRNQEIQMVVTNTTLLTARSINLFATGRILSQE